MLKLSLRYRFVMVADTLHFAGIGSMQLTLIVYSNASGFSLSHGFSVISGVAEYKYDAVNPIILWDSHSASGRM